MSFRSLIRFVFLARACGWPACRQYMISQGLDSKALALVLVHLLRMQGLKNKSIN